MATLRRSLGLLLLVLAASCGGGDGESAGDGASVSITAPRDGATVESPFQVAMAAEGFTIEAAGEVAEGSGHFHLIVDSGCVAAGETIPTDDAHIHLADGAGQTELTLPAGEHTLCLQAGDGQHGALDLTDEITVTVAGGGGDADGGAVTEGELAIQYWKGTYSGEVVWECGAAGTHRGSLDADAEILVFSDGTPALDAQHTVTGSCADTGSLTTPIYILGERTTSGFRFPSELWGIPGSFTIRVNGDRAEGRLSGEIPGPGTMSIVFDFECTREC